jgi:hypothetical protein
MITISPLEVVYPLNVGAELRLGASAASGIDSQRQLQQRVPPVLEPVVRQRFYAWQRLQHLGQRSNMSNADGFLCPAATLASG